MTKNIFNNWVTILNRQQAIIDSIEKHKLNVENNEYYMY
jgi:hypothetical protein